ncbi:DUF4189 domain-containing protein [Nocardia sp. XZ_19_231]|uniref:DUF4189 domain-containing protein n=1 Tax=Nocardia sp. XZ_19_231 TaxID=2769252 RepID=UPI00351C1567
MRSCVDGGGVIFHREVGYHRAIDDDLGGSGLSELFPEEIFRMSFMGKAGFAVAALGLAAGSVFGAGSASAASLHGVIAFSPDQWAYAYSVNESRYDDAYNEAMEICDAADCEIMISWTDGCGAIVESEQGVAAGAGATTADATNAALLRLAEITPTALLANVGSANLSGAEVVKVVCTANAR